MSHLVFTMECLLHKELHLIIINTNKEMNDNKNVEMNETIIHNIKGTRDRKSVNFLLVLRLMFTETNNT